MDEIRWRKSTYSSNGGASCIEVGQATRIVAVRDTKHYGRGPVLRFTPAAWRRFADQVKRSLASPPQANLVFADACRDAGGFNPAIAASIIARSHQLVVELFGD